MIDKQINALLNEFANNTSVATGGEICVNISTGDSSYTPKNKDSYMKFEDCNMLHDLIGGATQFLYFLERAGYKVIKKRGKVDK